jgi:hypothetical protein
LLLQHRQHGLTPSPLVVEPLVPGTHGG